MPKDDVHLGGNVGPVSASANVYWRHACTALTWVCHSESSRASLLLKYWRCDSSCCESSVTYSSRKCDCLTLSGSSCEESNTARNEFQKTNLGLI